mmetsp:Transcript_4822/g.14926  ORF Transcript_4822/g.14926 Transcript_4822/m.14926 type:complete len:236 (+) Transcript_4822:850-1557(+)
MRTHDTHRRPRICRGSGVGGRGSARRVGRSLVSCTPGGLSPRQSWRVNAPSRVRPHDSRHTAPEPDDVAPRLGAQLVRGAVREELLLVLLGRVGHRVSLLLNVRRLLLGELAHEGDRVAAPHLAAGDAPARWKDRAWLDDRVLLHEAALEEHGARADHAVVFDRARAQYRALPDGDPAADRAVGLEASRRGRCGVHDRALLDVGVTADRDGVDVRAHDRAVPHGHAVVENHVANH